jgi:glycosyltransferase involved in cell wall biosynthesis
MTVVINCRFLTQPTTGVQRFAERIVEYLTRSTPDLVLVAPPGQLSRTEFNGTPVRVIGSRGGHYWEQVQLPRFLRRFSPEALLVNLANTGPVRWKNQIVTLHDISYVRLPESYSRQFRWFYGWLIPRLLRGARAILTVSEFSKREIQGFYHVDAARITVVFNAVDDDFLQAEVMPRSVQPGASYFLVVSSLNVHKNVGPFIEMFKKYRATSGSGTELWIAGGSARSFTVSNLSAGGDGVRALGRVSDAELVWLYRHARAFVFPSLYEGFGIPPLEAQAAGAPVLASNAAALPEVLGQSALLVDPRAEEAVLTGLERLDTDAELRESLRAMGESNLKRFSWERSAAVVMDVLRSEGKGDCGD